MKATLTFDLPEERQDLFMALNGIHYAVALSDLDQRLRALAKYEDKDEISVEEARRWIREETEGLEGLDL